MLGAKFERKMHNDAPKEIKTIDVKSYLVNSSFSNWVARIELNIIVRELVELRVIMSANAKLTESK